MASAADKCEFQFEVNDAEFPAIHSYEMKQKFIKWDLTRSQVVRFRFDEPFMRMNADEFVSDFFNSPSVQECIMMVDRKGNPNYLKGKVGNCKHTELSCTKASLDMLDKVYERDIVREDDNYIHKCLDIFLDSSVTVADKLREVLMCGDESENYDLFTEEEKNEFLYHVLWRIASGGALCQWEDDFSVYRDTVKDIYKEMIGVQKNQHTNEVECTSVVYEVTGFDANVDLFARTAPNHNFCYLCVNPSRREVIYWYGGFVSMW